MCVRFSGCGCIGVVFLLFWCMFVILVDLGGLVVFICVWVVMLLVVNSVVIYYV